MWKHLLLVLLTSSAIAGEMRGSANSSSSSSSGATNLTGPVTSVGAATTIVGPIGINGLITSNTGVGVSTTAPVWPLTVFSASGLGLNSEQASGTTINTGMFWTTNAAVNTFVVRASSENASVNQSASVIVEANGKNGGATSFVGQVSSGPWSNRTLNQSANAAITSLSGKVWTGTTYPVTGRIILRTEGVPGSASNIPSYWVFETASTGTVTATEKMRLDSVGDLGVGSIAPAARIHASTAPSASQNVILADGVVAGSPGIATTGTLAQGTVGTCTLGLTSTSTGAITGCVTSDGRLKTRVVPLGSMFGTIDRLRPVTYSWKDPTAHDTERHLGFIAQEVEKVYPDAVVTQNHGFKGVEPNALIAVLVREVQELRKRVAELERKH